MHEPKSDRVIYNRTGGTHQSQLQNRKYRNWVKAGLGLKYVKEGLESFCDDLVKKQHVDIMNRVKQKHKLQVVYCAKCHLKTLMPDHVAAKKGQCPLGQVHCNCLHPYGKIVCPQQRVCSAIHDEIIQLHSSVPPSPYWRNTDVSKWCKEPWAIAACFINAPGYAAKLTASVMDTTAFLHLFINNIEFQSHLQCQITGQDIFSEVRRIRNIIMHSESLELKDGDVSDYIDKMIALLQDGKEIIHKPESRAAVAKLQELKREDFIIATNYETDVIKDVMQAITLKEKELKETIDDAHTEMDVKRAQFLSEAEEKLQLLDERLNVLLDVSVEDRRVEVQIDRGITVTPNVQTAVDNRSVNAARINVDRAGMAPVFHVSGSGNNFVVNNNYYGNQ